MGSNPIIYPFEKLNYSQKVKAIVFDTMNKGSSPFSSELKKSNKTGIPPVLIITIKSHFKGSIIKLKDSKIVIIYLYLYVF